MAETTAPEVVLAEFDRLKFLHEADLVLLQEVVHSPQQPGILETLVERLRLHALFATTSEPNIEGVHEGIAILSRRPFRDAATLELHRFGLHFRSRCRLALGITVENNAGLPVRVFGVHLDTRINAAERIRQLMPVVEAAERFDGPVIIGGDFNTNDVFWVQHTLPLPYAHNQRKRLREFLTQRGFFTPMNGRSPTFNHFGFRLDWIFTRSLETSEWGIEPISFSDHRAVWMRLVDANPARENPSPKEDPK